MPAGNDIIRSMSNVSIIGSHTNQASAGVVTIPSAANAFYIQPASTAIRFTLDGSDPATLGFELPASSVVGVNAPMPLPSNAVLRVSGACNIQFAQMDRTF